MLSIHFFVLLQETWQDWLLSIFLLFLLIAVLIALFKLIARYFPKILSWVGQSEGTRIRPWRLFGQEFVSAGELIILCITILRLAHLALLALLVYSFLSFAFGLFEETRAWMDALFSFLVSPVVNGLFLTAISTGIFLVIYRFINLLFPFMTRVVRSWKGTRIRTISIQSTNLLTAERITNLLSGALRIGRFAALILLWYLFLPTVFSFFDATQTWASTLIGYVLKPILTMASAFVNYLPNLITIVVILFISRYVLKFIAFIFKEIDQEAITLPGFLPEWAAPTYKIVRFLILVFVAIVVFPYLPGSDSPAFQGISLFVGVLFSLGSTTAIANIVAGVVLTYMRPFRVGDRVKIADTMGDVIEKTLLVTRVRTVKNVDITIPNAMVLGSHIINFSTSADDRGLILHTVVTIGYDVPWRQVHDLLISAALATGHILKEPSPFVLQTGLNDYYPVYELNAYTNNPSMMARIYSELHQNIQDKFNESGVEILSPAYSAVRDGNSMAVPPDYLPKSYQAPGFRLFSFGNPTNKEGH